MFQGPWRQIDEHRWGGVAAATANFMDLQTQDRREFGPCSLDRAARYGWVSREQKKPRQN